MISHLPNLYSGINVHSFMLWQKFLNTLIKTIFKNLEWVDLYFLYLFIRFFRDRKKTTELSIHLVHSKRVFFRFIGYANVENHDEIRKFGHLTKLSCNNWMLFSTSSYSLYRNKQDLESLHVKSDHNLLHSTTAQTNNAPKKVLHLVSCFECELPQWLTLFPSIFN